MKLRKIEDLFLTMLIFCAAIFFVSCEDKNNPATVPPGAGYGTPFSNVPSTENIIMYEVNIRAFSAEGKLRGVTARLDAIKALGVNVVWVMPVFPVGKLRSVNSPYCISDFTSVGSEFGTITDLRELVEGAHKRDMAVILDWVANHTSWDNKWIDSSNWYTKDGNGNIISPPGTNWTDVAELNYNNRNMRRAMIDAMKWWVTNANIDGFRCDAADFVPYDFWLEALSELNALEGRKLIFLAEGARSDHFSAGFQMNFSWEFYGTMKNVFRNNYSSANLFITHNQEYSKVPAGKKKLRFTTNHDESAWDATPMNIFNGKKGALAAAVIAAYLGGVPLVYGSQEVGVTEKVPFFSNAPINWSLNPDMLAEYKRILNFYNSSDALKKGMLEPFPGSEVNCFRKMYDSLQVLTMVNTRNYNVTYSVPPALTNTAWTNVFTGEVITFTDTIRLSEYAYLIMKK